METKYSVWCVQAMGWAGEWGDYLKTRHGKPFPEMTGDADFAAKQCRALCEKFDKLIFIIREVE